MKVIPPNNMEIAWRQCRQMLMLNPLAMPNYYGALFSSFKALLNEEHNAELNNKIKEIEEWLSDEYNPMTLSEAETRMFQNMDLLSGFQVNGKMITQMEINQKLEEIKDWLQNLLFLYQPHIRFSQTIRID